MFTAITLVTGCSPSEVKTGARITSYSNLYEIGLAIRQFKDENGALPMHLSDIVPRNIPLNKIGIFYVTNKFAYQQVLPSDWSVNPRRIDVYSSYNYVGTSNINGIIAFEKSNLWRPSTVNADKVAVLFSDFHVEYVSIAKMQTYISPKQ
jgi:hypothetical protein